MRSIDLKPDINPNKQKHVFVVISVANCVKTTGVQ